MGGVGDFRHAMEVMVAAAAAASMLAVGEAALAIEAEAKANFSGSHRKGQPHVGGNKPNVVTGTLRRSIHVEGPLATHDGATATVGPSMIYGRRVELGFKGSTAYPYFQPGVDKVTPRIAEIAARQWAAAIAKL